MSNRSLLVLVLLSLGLAAASLILADALDAPALALVGCAAVVVAVVARERLLWSRRSLLALAAIIGTIAVAVLVSRASR